MNTVLLLLALALLVVLHRQVHRLNRAVHRITHKEHRLMDNLEDVLAIVTEQTTRIEGVVAFINTLKDERVTPEARAALIEHLTGNNAALEAAIAANVPTPPVEG